MPIPSRRSRRSHPDLHLPTVPTVMCNEAHSAKFGSHYLRRKLYLVVYPPLCKMFVGRAGPFACYHGCSDRESGEQRT